MLPLLAQFQQNNNAVGPELAGPILVGVCCFLLVFLVIAILFLLTLQKALSRCSPRNRTMEPGMVWLNLIPLFNIVWQFITVTRVAESLRNEFRTRGRSRNEDFGYGVGMTYCVMNIIGGVINGVSNVVPIVGLLGLPVGLIGLVCGIIYWVKIAGYSAELARGRGYDDDDYDDDDDDRPRRRSRRDEDDEDDDRPRRRRDEDEDDDDDDRGRPWNRGGR